MATITLRREEAESGDLPPVCMYCGDDADTRYPRRYNWSPLVFPPLLRLLLTRRMNVQMPVCPRHDGPRFWNGPSLWGACRPVNISNESISLAGVDDEFADVLDDYRDGRGPDWPDEDDEPRQRRPRRRPERPAKSGGSGALLAVFIVLGVMLLTPMLVCGGFAVVGFLTLRTGAPSLPPFPPPAVAGQGGFKPEYAAFLAGTPNADFPAPVPWAALALMVNNDGLRWLSDDEITAVLRKLKGSPGEAMHAASRLAEARPVAERRDEVARDLVAALSHPSPTAREAAAWALVAWGTPESEDALILLLADPFPKARAAAMRALAALRSDEAAAAVAARLKDSRDRDEARDALATMGPPAEKAVLPFLSDPDARIRTSACQVLEAVGARASVDPLTAAANDKDRAVSAAATAALKAVNGRVNRFGE